MTLTVELVLFIAAAILLGLAAFGVRAGRMSLVYAAATLIVIGLLVVPEF